MIASVQPPLLYLTIAYVSIIGVNTIISPLHAKRRTAHRVVASLRRLYFTCAVIEPIHWHRWRVKIPRVKHRMKYFKGAHLLVTAFGN